LLFQQPGDRDVGEALLQMLAVVLLMLECLRGIFSEFLTGRQLKVE